MTDHNQQPGLSVSLRLDLVCGHEMIVREVEFVGLTLPGVEGVAGERGDRPPLALRCDSLLLLSPVTEPDPDHLLVQVERVTDLPHLLRRWLGVLYKRLL